MRDPVPIWSLDPGFGIPGWAKNQDPDPGCTSRIIFRKAEKQFFGLKILKLFFADLDPGSGIFLTLDPGCISVPWINIPDPQHRFCTLRKTNIQLCRWVKNSKRKLLSMRVPSRPRSPWSSWRRRRCRWWGPPTRPWWGSHSCCCSPLLPRQSQPEHTTHGVSRGRFVYRCSYSIKT